MPAPEPYYSDASVTVLHGDCLDVLRTLPDHSVDAVVTDPPYGLGFMGKEWDSGKSFVERKAQRSNTFDHVGGNHNPVDSADSARTRRVEGQRYGQWCEQWATECLRVLKPGGHLLAFGGTRTWHRLACAVEDAGFEVRDSIAWLYGSGFPKSLDVSKAIDKAAGAEREVVGYRKNLNRTAKRGDAGAFHSSEGGMFREDRDEFADTAPATDDARTWQGWGTALKPAFEPIVVARKPLAGTVAANVLAHGTGALNVDGCRVEGGPRPLRLNGREEGGGDSVFLPGNVGRAACEAANLAGRWPANVVLDEDQAAALDEQSGVLTSGGGDKRGGCEFFMGGDARSTPTGHEPDSGGASRFFFVAPSDNPADDAFRGAPMSGDTKCWYVSCWNYGRSVFFCGHPSDDDLTTTARFKYTAKADSGERVKVNGTAHPTVKPLSLMRWLVRLVTPPGGTVLEPFAGSGTTVEACILEGFRCIAIEREADYLPLITQRIHRRRDPVAAIRQASDDGGLFDLLDTEEPA